MRPADTAMAEGKADNTEFCMSPECDDALDEAYSSWREVWDLDDMTARQIYEAGFRHGYEAGRKYK